MRYHYTMKAKTVLLNPVVLASAMFFAAYGSSAAQDSIDTLLERLQSANPDQAEQIVQEIWAQWSKSGSDAMDLLLSRGRAAMAAGDAALAVQHLTALVDHAPDFAEGWNARATAYYQAGAFGPAVADIARTLSLNPQHFGALTGLGAIFEELGAPEKAIDAYRAALDINPHATSAADAIARLQTQISGIDL